MNTNKMEKLNELFKNAAFVEKVRELETTEEIQKLLAGEGVELTMEEMEEIVREYEKLTGENGSELSDDQMGNVAGGGAVAIGLFAFGVAQLAGLVQKQLKSSKKSTKKSSKKRR